MLKYKNANRCEHKKSKIQLPKSEINLYLCRVNQEVSHFNISVYFHGALHQANRLFNHSIFFIDDIFHQITCGIITC
jgi:hypothetical protein